MSSTREQLTDASLVFVGGAAGTAVRYVLTSVFATAGGLPMVFAINVTGAFLLGMLSEHAKNADSTRRWMKLSLLLGTGALGGYTTYGTFAADAEGLLDSTRSPEGALYGLATVVIGVGAAYAGTLIATRNRDRVEKSEER